MNLGSLQSLATIGSLMIIVLGTISHFVFNLADRWWPLAFVFPVNESVWEHLKLAFWPALLFGVLEWWWLRDNSGNLLVATVLSALIGPLLIVLLFYGYTAILGRNLFVFDMLTFIIAVAAAQWLSYRVLASGEDLSRYNGLALLVLAVAMVAFLSLSFAPPRWDIFRDPPSGGYGISAR
ncbi:MAG: DUF6512 family protein [Bacillota bacterium]